MKKLFLILSVALFALGTVNAFAQEAAAAAETQLAGDSLHHVMMQKFLEGGWAWMLPILIFLIIGLAVAIERILYLSLSTINSKKLITKVEEALKNGGIEAAKEVCRNTRGPIASIYYQGLLRYNQGPSDDPHGSYRCGYSSAVLQLYRFEDRLARERYGGFVHHADGYPDGLQQEIIPTI